MINIGSLGDINIGLPNVFKFLFKPKRYKVAYGGRGSGKSVGFVRALLALGILKPIKILCCRELQSSIKDSVKSEFDLQINLLGMGKYYNSYNTCIKGTNGTEILFHGIKNNVSNIKSIPNINIAFVEEAANISKNSLGVLIPTVRAEGSEIWIVFNPNLEEDPVYDMFVMNKRDDAYVVKLNYYNNPFLPDVLKSDILYDRLHNYKKYENVWLGQTLDTTEAAVFTNFRTDITITDREAERRDLTPYFGMDFGFSVDPTALIKCYLLEEERELHIVDEAYEHKLEIDGYPEFIRSVPGAEDDYITADSSDNKLISYLNKQGFYLRPAQKGPESIISGIRYIQNFTVIINQRCKNTNYEFNHYSHEVNPQTEQIRPKKFVDKDNHTIDALRYALEMVRLQGHFNIA